MTTLIDMLSGPLWREILLTLAYSLWQGAAIALILAIILNRVAGDRPQARYLASLVSLATLVISCLVTWSILDLPAPRPTAGETVAVSTAVIVDAGPTAAKAPSSPMPAMPLPAQSSWQTLAAVCNAAWLAGVTAMLVRMAWLLTGVRRLARHPALTDTRVLEIVERLRRQLGILRRVAVVDAATFGPAVLGVLQPVLLLPAAIITEMSPDCLEAILAHELAHIRRHDYLVNLLQMLVEAALFFNPAVWWISRQIRREREACCDALAVGVTGQPLTYAEALASWVEHTTATGLTPAAIGWLGERNGRRGRRSGSLLDRVQRLIIAGYRPELRGSWPTLAAGLAICLPILIALCGGTRVGVAFAAEILSPKQRLEQLAAKRDEFRPTGDPAAKITISGTARSVSGEPLPQRFGGRFDVQREHYGAGNGFSIKESKFSFQAAWGRTWLLGFAPGYAPAILGPFQTKPGDRLDGLEMVFEPGLTARLRIVDAEGAPISEAKSEMTFSEPTTGPSYEWKTDDSGLRTAEHVADAPYNFTISAPGFQTLRLKSVRFKAGETMTQTLLRAQPVEGIVVTPEGAPISGANIRVVGRCLEGTSFYFLGREPVLATTDQDGHFAIESLDSNTLYWLLVETTDQGARVFGEIRSGQAGLRWAVGPNWIVRGRVLGDIEKIKASDGTARVEYFLSYTLRQAGRPAAGFTITNDTAEITNVGDEHRFELKNLLPDHLSLTIKAGEQRLDLLLDKPSTEVTIDLDKPLPKLATRHVVLRFVGADPGLAPSGQIHFSSHANNFENPGTAMIEKDRAEFDVSVPSSVTYRMENIVGYWFKEGTFDAPLGTTPLIHDVPVVSAGAIRGSVLNADGTPVKGDMRVSAESTQPWAWLWGNSRPDVLIQNVPVDASGEFFISPLPLSRSYVVQAWRDFENACSEPIRLNAAEPNPTIDLPFSPPRDIQGQVLGSAGQALAGIPLAIQFSSPYADMSFSTALVTDPDGRFEIKRLSSRVGQYRLAVEPRRDFQPAVAILSVGGPSLEIQLKAGHVIEGRLLDRPTGKPLAGVELLARPLSPPQPGHATYRPDEPQTDADGRFRFSTLPEGKYGIQAYGIGWPVSDSPPADQIFSTDKTVELKVLPPRVYRRRGGP